MSPHVRITWVAYGLALWSLAAIAADTVAIHNVPPQVVDGTATLTGHEDTAFELHLVIGLRPPHMVDQDEFLSHPGNRLTAEEWNARFGPSAETEDAVIHWVEAQGLKVTGRFPNRLLIDVTGTTEAL